jgi:hypothetical protein
MSLLISIAIFLAGLAVGYLWALFEIWLDGREQAVGYDELRERVEETGRRKG